MKKILLLGDSIRFGAPNSPGYGVYVAEMLKERATVYAPDENCRFAQYTLRQIYNWVTMFDPASIDVVHWNNGLWDVLRLHGDEPLSPLPVYLSFLSRIYKKLRLLFPKARIVFATSTAVVEEWANPNFMRYNKEIEEYNAAAKALLSTLGAEINDLYPVSAALGAEMRSDWVHYNEEGSRILAEAVVKAIGIED